MKLLTFRQRLGPSEENIRSGLRRPIDISRVCYITNLSLGEAIEKVAAYEREYNKNNSAHTELKLSLTGYSVIEELTIEQTRLARLVWVETLLLEDGTNELKY